MDAKRACRIAKTYDDIGWRDEDHKWEKLHHMMVDAMIRFEKAIRPYVGKLKV